MQASVRWRWERARSSRARESLRVKVCIPPDASESGKKRHEVPLPQNFRRLLSSKLRRLVAQEKLEKIQNCYKKKEDSSFGTRVPLPKPIWVRQSQNPGSNASIDTVEEAAAAAAYKIAEAESKSFVACGAVAEAEKVAKMAEEAESLVLLAKQIFEQCSRGEIVLVA